MNCELYPDDPLLLQVPPLQLPLPLPLPCQGCFNSKTLLHIKCKEDEHFVCQECFETNNFQCNVSFEFDPCGTCHFIHHKGHPCPVEAEKNKINQSYQKKCGKGTADLSSSSGLPETLMCDFCLSSTPSGFCPLDGIYYCMFCLPEYQCRECGIVRTTSRFYKRKGEKVYKKRGCNRPCA